MNYTTEDIIGRFQYSLDNHHYNWILNKENNIYFDLDNNFEYQIRSYLNGDFRSILVRQIDDITHSYKEYFNCDYEYVEDLIEEAISQLTKDRIIEDKLKKGKNYEMC